MASSRSAASAEQRPAPLRRFPFLIDESFGLTGGQSKQVRRGRSLLKQEISIHCFVVAGGAARFAIEQAVGAETDTKLRLAKYAELVARTILLGLLALRTEHPAAGWCGGHDLSVVPGRGGGNVT